MKIYADENIERSIIEGVRRCKIEVVSHFLVGTTYERRLKKEITLLFDKAAFRCYFKFL